jgi:hypothetical protein
MLYTQTYSYKETIKQNVFILPSVKLACFYFNADQNIAEVVCTTWKFDLASYRLLSGYAFTACVHNALRVKIPERGCGNAGNYMSEPSGHNMYRQFNIQQFYVPNPWCIYVFCVYLKKKQQLFPYTTLTDWIA